MDEQAYDEQVYLVKPSMEFEDEYKAFFNEWVASGEDMVPWVIDKDPSDFPSMLQFLYEHEHNVNLPDGWVPSSTFWLATETRRVIGVVNIRHWLTDRLMNADGHIGYGIRPSERRKGYATKLLEMSLTKAKELGIERALLSCDETNTGSEKTILHNGGVQDKSSVDENNNVVHRFWIDI